MAPTGFISAALSSLKNNSRPRRKGIEEPKTHIVPTKYDFPTVSAKKRKEVVAEILAKRKPKNRLIAVIYIVFGLVILFIVTLFIISLIRFL